MKTASKRKRKRDPLPPVIKVREVPAIGRYAQFGQALSHKAGEAVSYGGAPEKIKAELMAARRAINTALRALKMMGY